MDFFETINNRCSVRAFERLAVSDKDLTSILECARRAPTAFTAEPWHFVVVRQRDKLQALGAVQPCIAEAELAIVAIGDPIKSDFWREDLSAAVQNMHLAATALGYASLWVAVLDKSLVAPILNVPDKLTPLAILPIGKPAAEFTQAPRKPLSDVVYLDEFGSTYHA